MEINDIITLQDNREYLILDRVSLNNIYYDYGVLVDKDENPTGDYIYFKETMKNNEIYVEEVQDKDTLETLISMFTLKVLNKTNEEQED